MFPLEGSQRLKGCLFKLLFTLQTRTAPLAQIPRSQAILANTDHSLYHELLGENVTEGKRLLQNTFQARSCNKCTRFWALTEIQAATTSEFIYILFTAHTFKDRMDCILSLGSQCVKQKTGMAFSKATLLQALCRLYTSLLVGKHYK